MSAYMRALELNPRGAATGSTRSLAQMTSKHSG
jgi:hypothetical protein